MNLVLDEAGMQYNVAQSSFALGDKEILLIIEALLRPPSRGERYKMLL
jgi:hypothetical protein